QAASGVGAGNGSGYPAGSAGIRSGTFAVSDGTHMGSGFVAGQLQSVQVTSKSETAPSSSVEGATGAALGELFEYDFGGAITIKKNQSAMLPFLHDRVTARKLLIYTERDGEHPVNAAEVTNDTSKTLDGGPITVFDGGAYAGEALFETLKP